MILTVRGKQSIKITKVISVGGTRALHFIDAYVAGPERPVGQTFRIEAFPPPTAKFGQLVPAKDAILRPHSQKPVGQKYATDYELLLGYRFTGKDIFDFRSRIDVYYQVDGMQYVARIPGRVILCPKGMSDDECILQEENRLKSS